MELPRVALEARDEDPRILCFLNNPLETYIEKGLRNWFPRYLNPSGIFSNIFVIYPFNKSGCKTIQGVRVYHVRPIPVVWIFLMLYQALKVIRKERIDIMRAYDPQIEGLIALICQFLTKVPAVISIHNQYDLLMQIRRYPFFTRLGAHLVEKIVYTYSKGVFCTSSALAKYVVEHAPNHRGKVCVTYNKVDVKKFRTGCQYRASMRQKHGFDDDVFVLILASRFAPEKNIPTLIRAFGAVTRMGIRTKLVLVGDGDQRSLITELIKNFNLQNDVLLTGFILNDFLPRYFAMADAFVLPSLVEGFGIVFVEAQAAGLPIIAGNIPYISEVVNKENSLLVNPNNPSQLTEKIVELALDKSLQNRLRKTSLQNADKFEWPKVERLEAKCYLEVLGSSGKCAL